MKKPYETALVFKGIKNFKFVMSGIGIFFCYIAFGS